MTIPVLQGTIARRILVNYRADAAIVQPLLPAPFRPKLYAGHAIIGVCLIRLEAIRPLTCSLPTGFSSESAAHRIAIEWDEENGETREGVFIPRRDTGSLVNHLVGGRLFPGQHHLADFEVEMKNEAIDFHMCSRDGQVEVRLQGKVSQSLPANSCFPSLQEASAFFEGGCVGFSVRRDSDRLDALTLRTKEWRVETLDVSQVYSSFFANETRFAPGSVHFDHALLMRDIAHEWHPAQVPTEVGAGL